MQRLEQEVVGLLEPCLDVTKLTLPTSVGCVHMPQGGTMQPYQALFCEGWWSCPSPKEDGKSPSRLHKFPVGKLDPIYFDEMTA